MEQIMRIIDDRLESARRNFKHIDRKYREAIMIGYFDLAGDYDRQRIAIEKVIDELVEIKKQIGAVYSE